MVLAHDISKGGRTQDVQISENVTFETMLLTPRTIQGLYNAGFYRPSPIQLCGIPVGKCGFDLLLEAKSGTGKTAVFSIIALEKLDFSKGLQVVILTPTREIAAQIYDVLQQIGAKYEALQIAVVMGGLSVKDDIAKFRKDVHIVVGSPGRLKQLILEKYINTSAVRLLVLDEADKLMEKVFQADIKYIYSVLPKQKQVIMSSATFSEFSKNFIKEFVQNAQHICPNSDSILLGIEQKVTLVKYNSNIVRQTENRHKELLKILAHKQFKQCIVFCNFQARVSEIHKVLTREKWPSDKLYGRQEQTDRLDALKTLQQYQCRIMVSTDLAARGIDASNIDLVINFEPPLDWQSYLHRIGRAGRFGSYGVAITILSEGQEQQKFKDILKPMAHSLNILKLWTHDKFIIDNSAPSHNTEKSEEKMSMIDSTVQLHNVECNTIWEELCSTTQETNLTDTFQNLCNSFENVKSQNIETFSDLMLSFKDKEIIDDTQILYKHLKIKKSMPQSQQIPNNTTQLPEELNISSAASIITENNMNKVENKNENKNTINGIKEALPLDIQDSKPYPVENGDVTTYTNNQDNGQLALLHTGLPPAFSSSKEKKRHQRSHTYGNENELKFHEGFEKNKTDSEWLKISKSKKNVDSNRYEKCKKSNTVNSNVHVKDHMSYKSKNVTAAKIGNNAFESKSYNNWYNQLKTKIKQIEMAVYIDELSKV